MYNLLLDAANRAIEMKWEFIKLARETGLDIRIGTPMPIATERRAVFHILAKHNQSGVDHEFVLFYDATDSFTQPYLKYREAPEECIGSVRGFLEKNDNYVTIARKNQNWQEIEVRTLITEQMKL